MATRQIIPSPYQWRNRVMIKFLASDYWWNQTGGTDIGGGRTITNTTGEKIISTHLREEIALTANTQFQSLIESSPIGSVMETIQSSGGFLGNALGGVGKFLQVQTWKSTDQLSFPLTLHFDTDTNPRNDVFLPSIALFGYTVPEETKEKILKTPGPNIFSLIQKVSDDYQNKKAEDFGLASDSKARLISVLIGGWLYLNGIVLKKADPTFSKEVTESGYPLWSEISCEVTTLKTTTLDLLVGIASDAQKETNISQPQF